MTVYRYTDRKTNRQTNRQIDRKTDKRIYRQMSRQTDGRKDDVGIIGSRLALNIVKIIGKIIGF